VSTGNNAGQTANQSGNTGQSTDGNANTGQTASGAGRAANNAGQASNNAGQTAAGANTTATRTNPANQRQIGRIVYIPGYGYMTWAGDYNNPYWRNNGSSGYAGNSTPATQPDARLNRGVGASRRAQEDSALAEMTTARSRVSKQFEAMDDVRTALHDVQDAQRNYDAAIADANRRLKQDPDFQQAQAQKKVAAEKVEAAQAADHQRAQQGSATQPAPISRTLVRAAEQKLNAASQATSIAQQDPAVTDAKKKLEAASDRLNGLKANFDAALQSDPQWQSAKAKLDSARAGEPK
jgi:hypothetical protein